MAEATKASRVSAKRLEELKRKRSASAEPPIQVPKKKAQTKSGPTSDAQEPAGLSREEITSKAAELHRQYLALINELSVARPLPTCQAISVNTTSVAATKKPAPRKKPAAKPATKANNSPLLVQQTPVCLSPIANPRKPQ